MGRVKIIIKITVWRRFKGKRKGEKERIKRLRGKNEKKTWESEKENMQGRRSNRSLVTSQEHTTEERKNEETTTRSKLGRRKLKVNQRRNKHEN